MIVMRPTIAHVRTAIAVRPGDRILVLGGHPMAQEVVATKRRISSHSIEITVKNADLLTTTTYTVAAEAAIVLAPGESNVG